MAQKYRIYINEKVILLTGNIPKHSENYQVIDSEYFDLEIIYHWVDKHKATQFYVLCDEPKAFLKKIADSVKLVEAAGGLVKNENSEYLFIYRNDKWDLPKGKIEKKEKNRVAAVREVEEECGIRVDKLNDKICKTYHVYIWKGVTVLKKTYWYNMHYKGSAALVPQTEEGITDVRWFKTADIKTILSNTYPSIMDVLEKTRLVKDRESLPLG